MSSWSKLLATIPVLLAVLPGIGELLLLADRDDGRRGERF